MSVMMITKHNNGYNHHDAYGHNQYAHAHTVIIIMTHMVIINIKHTVIIINTHLVIIVMTAKVKFAPFLAS